MTALSVGKCVVTVTSAQNNNVSASVAVTVVSDPQLTYIDGILIANKTYALPADYAPGVDPQAEAAFYEMQADAYELGLNLYISSGYRSYDYQAGLYQRYVERSGKTEADRYSARPGYSEHQTGLAFDLNTISDEFKDTDEGKWVAENCHKYGFIVRYPEDKESVTGYMYEPWHIRYLGTDTATAVYESGLCLEEYLGITSEYDE
ncbi:MAG: M15 family metallopeptidase [Oscillospiraceae bacterium]|nr:M15 family metallopeptidase [Oscillospiraceae bacterium]